MAGMNLQNTWCITFLDSVYGLSYYVDRSVFFLCYINALYTVLHPGPLYQEMPLNLVPKGSRVQRECRTSKPHLSVPCLTSLRKGLHEGGLSGST